MARLEGGRATEESPLKARGMKQRGPEVEATCEIEPCMMVPPECAPFAAQQQLFASPPRPGPGARQMASPQINPSVSEEVIAALQAALVEEQNRAAHYRQQLTLARREHQADVAALRAHVVEAQRELETKLHQQAKNLAAKTQEAAVMQHALEIEQGRSEFNRRELEASRREQQRLVEQVQEAWKAARAERDAAQRSQQMVANELVDARVMLAAAQGRANQLERILAAADEVGAPVDQLDAMQSAAQAEMDAALKELEKRHRAEIEVLSRELAAMQRHAYLLQGRVEEWQAEGDRLHEALASTEKEGASVGVELERLQAQLAEKDAELASLREDLETARKKDAMATEILRPKVDAVLSDWISGAVATLQKQLQQGAPGLQAKVIDVLSSKDRVFSSHPIAEEGEDEEEREQPKQAQQGRAGAKPGQQAQQAAKEGAKQAQQAGNEVAKQAQQAGKLVPRPAGAEVAVVAVGAGRPASHVPPSSPGDTSKAAAEASREEGQEGAATAAAAAVQ